MAERDYSATVAARTWAGLTRPQWRQAHAEGHACTPGQPGAVGFRMNDGFHCPCGAWSMPHTGGAVSDVREGYRRWGEHVVESLALTTAPRSRT